MKSTLCGLLVFGFIVTSNGRFLDEPIFKFLKPPEPFLTLMPNDDDPLMSLINKAADNSPLPFIREFMGRQIESQLHTYRSMLSPLMINDPDLHSNVSQLISSKGYPVEEHHIQTKDGFILGVQRIARGRNQDVNESGDPRPVILLQHGLLGSASDWVLNFPTQSLGFLLADAGYDVWLGNARGNSYSRRHVHYSPADSEFWKFSIDDVALFDLPAVIDYIRMKTNQDQISYIGHSMGTTVIFALLSEMPEYNNKIKVVIALAPVANVTYITAPIRYLAPMAGEVSLLLKVLGQNEFAPNDAFNKVFTDMVCGVSMSKQLCDRMVFLIGGEKSTQLNETRVPVYLHHFPSGTSTLTVIQFAQMVNSKQFKKFDFGPRFNFKKYGQVTPPIYDVGKITTPIALYWSLNDLLSDPTDVELLGPKIKNLIKSYKVPFPQFTHLDFAIGLQAKKLLYDDVMSTLEVFQ